MTTQHVTNNQGVAGFEWANWGDTAATDLINILDTVDVPIVVVRRDFKLACFNKAAAEVLALKSSDLGRAPRDIPMLASLPRLEEQCSRVVATGVEIRADFRDGDKWFVVRLSPYTKGDHQVAGTVLTFTNVTAFRASIDQAIYERECTKAILNTVADPLVVLSSDQQIQSGNRAFYTMFAVSRDQTRRVSLYEFGDGAFELPQLRDQLEEMVAGSDSFQPVEVDYPFPERGNRTLVLNARPLSLPGHSERRVLVTFRDITARKQAEAAKDLRSKEELRRSEAFLAEGQRLSLTGSFSWKVATDEITWSEQLYRIYEFEIGVTLTPDLIRTRVHPEDRTLLEKMVEHVRRGDSDFEWQYRLLMPDNSIKYLHAVAHATRDQDGQLEYIAAVQDMTQRRLAEEALGESERMSRLIVDSIPGLVALLTATGEVEIVNRQLIEYFGQTLEELRQWGTNGTVHPEDLPYVMEIFTRAIASGTPYEIVQRLRRSDGLYRWLQNSGVPIRDTDGRIARWCVLLTDIDDRKRAEDKLRRSDARKTAILDSALDCIISIDHEGRIIEFNPAAERTFAYRREDVIGEQLADVIIPPSLREQHKQGLARYLATGDERVLGKRIEMTAVRADGSEFPVELAITRIQSDGPPLFTGYLRDITERKGSLERLQAKQDLLDLAQKSAGAMAFDWHIQEEINSWSPEQEALFGLAPGTFDGTYKTWKSMMYAPDWPTVVEAIQHAQQTGRVSAEYRVVWPDGSLHWLSTNGRMFFDDEGKPLRMVGFTSDVSRRKQAEEELRRSEAFLAEGQHLARLGNFSWSIEKNEITWSEQMYRIFGFDSSLPVTLELIATRVHPDDIGLLQDMVERAQRGVSDFEYEHRLLMPDNSVKYLHLIAHRSRDEQGRVEYIGAVQDVTQRRISEEALSEARSELARVARIMSLGVLTASIAHEVNQPLSGIITNASTCVRMLDADPPNVDGARETAKRTIRDGNRASEVIKRLRALFGRKEFTAESVDLNEAAQEVIALCRSELQRSQVVLQTEFALNIPLVEGDRIQLQQVILNLLRNASDAMSGIDDRPRRLTIKTGADGNERVRLSVHDAGVGFAMEEADKLFDAFYTTKKSGMGIGLSVSRSIIESHHGRLWAMQNEGPGATFCFSIPCAPHTSSGPASDGAKREALG